MASLNEVLRARALEEPERRACGLWGDLDVERWLTVGELDRSARAIATALQSCRPGERAMLLYPPGLEYVTAFYGCLYANVIAVPAYPPDPARLDRTLPRLQAIISDAQATVVLTTSAIVSVFESMAAHLAGLTRLRWIATDTLEDADGWRAPAVDERTVAFLQYTSGSTGSPKGVVVTQGNLLHNVAAIANATQSSPSQTIVSWLPPYHDMGLIGSIIHGVHVGSPVVLMSPATFLIRPVRWLQAVSRTQATMSGGPNFAFDLCVQKVSAADRARLDLSAWRFAYVAAEPVRPKTLERFAETFAECGFRRRAFFPCYGLAEGTLIVSGVELLGGYRTRAIDGGEAVGVGRPIGGAEVRVVDPVAATPCAEGEVGEIWCRSPSVAAGYWNKPDESAAVFGARLADGDGPWLRTGDLGVLEGGELFVTGRIKEVVIVRGRKHYPTDLEETAEQAVLGASYHRPGGSAAFSLTVGGEERAFVAIEIERRQRERRRMIETAAERRRGADRRHRPFHYKSAVEPTAFDPEATVRAIRRAIAAEHGIELGGVLLLRPGSIPKTSSGKKQRLACRRFLDGERPPELLFCWSGLDPATPMKQAGEG